MAGESEHLYEHVIVGGGLAGGLVALALAERGCGAGVALVEGDARLGGNHTWSFHDSDLGPDERKLVAPLVTARWPRHEVRFPGFTRRFEAGYASVSSDRFAEVVSRRLAAAGVEVRLGARVREVGSSIARLDDDTMLRGRVVIDARGPCPDGALATSAFQKFVGLELELAADGPWTSPVLMDATVAQIGGYRFVYVLPFSRRRVLIEDTVYSDNASIDPTEGAKQVLAYAERHGARVDSVRRREVGVLPLPLRGPKRPPATTYPIAVGYRGGFLHPVTGYSLPIAARLAVAIAEARTPGETLTAVSKLSAALGPQRHFGQLLNRMLFEAMSPTARWTALARFYRLPDSTIARFYASRSTLSDRARMLIGRPPAGISWKRLLGGRSDQTHVEVS